MVAKKRSKKKVSKSKNNFKNRNLIIGVVVLVVVFLLLVNFTGYSEEGGLSSTSDYYGSVGLLLGVGGEDEVTFTESDVENLITGIISDVNNGFSDEEVKSNAMSFFGFGSDEGREVGRFAGVGEDACKEVVCENGEICIGGACAPKDDGSYCGDGTCDTGIDDETVECFNDQDCINLGLGNVCRTYVDSFENYCSECRISENVDVLGTNPNCNDDQDGNGIIENPVCELFGSCVSCGSDQNDEFGMNPNCGGLKPLCHFNTHTCNECNPGQPDEGVEGNCPNLDKNYCHNDGLCVECKFDEHCGSGEVCNIFTKTCQQDIS